MRTRIETLTIGVIIAAGLLLAGSDSSTWFPWNVIAGVVLLGLAAILIDLVRHRPAP